MSVGTKPILVLGGPTAAGKTDAAIAVAQRWRGVRLVSADAMQVFRGFDIGTGKPDPATLAAAPHACIDVREAHEPYSAADFAADADAIIAQHDRVVVVGGTGFYLRALLVGLAPAPSADPALRAELEAKDDPHAELSRVDPVMAARLHPNDRVRVVRALEVFYKLGRPFSEVQAEHAFEVPRHEASRLWLDRADLEERIDRRVLQMVAQGYVAEVQGLLARGVSPESRPMRSLGYRWMVAHLHAGLPLDEAIAGTQRDTRRFARKQRLMLRSIGGFTRIEDDHLGPVLDEATRLFGPPDRAL